MSRFMSNRIIVPVVVVAIVIVLIGVIFVSGVFNQPTAPDVKFIDFKPEGAITLKQGQAVQITFNVVNNENFAARNINVVTSHDGQPEFFTIDRPTATITGSLGANGGRTGLQTINVIGNTSDQDAVEADFTVRLFAVDGQLTDTRTFKVRLEK